MKLLITGGAGYIGSHVVLAALEQGCKVTIFDDLSTGLKENINDNTNFIFGSTFSKVDLNKLFKNDKFDAVVHLAGSKASGDSMVNPSTYAENNIIGAINLINACLEFGVKIFIFSSSAAVYGKPKFTPIDEKHSLNPSNYYGYTKLCIENNLSWFSKLKNMRYASLRYFNAAGYDIKKRINGLEVHSHNLIPKIMEVALGKKKKVNIYGKDYNTKDGTGIRDYVHVSDLASGHIDSINYIIKNDKNLTINLGTRRGYSVLEIINKTIQISEQNIQYRFQNRRAGDSGIIISNPSLAKNLINWDPKFSDLDTIIQSTWDAYRKKYYLY